MRRRIAVIGLLTLVVGTLAACGESSTNPVPDAETALDQTANAEVPAPATVVPPSPTSAPSGYWIQPGVPRTIVDNITPSLTQAGLVPVAIPEEATLRVVLNPGPDAALSARWVLVPVAPFPTVPDNIALGAVQAFWQGDPNALAAFGTPSRLVITPDVADLLIALWGPPSEAVALDLVDAGGLVDYAWNVRPAISLVPFEKLDPRWKALRLDGWSAFDKTLDMNAYPLAITVGIVAEGDLATQAVGLIQGNGVWQPTNRDPAKLTIIVMTGVTAMSRATAWHMEMRGLEFPALNIMPFFADADILHTSNEVAFATDCPEPELEGEAVFCSQRDYLALLQYIGLDIVELTGNHINDWGTAALSYTLDVYDGNGIPYYGGGRNLEDAITPRILTTPNGTRVAFVGCNSAGPYSAWATDYSPGAAPCGDWTAFWEQIAVLSTGGQADVVIATLQYTELPQYNPSLQQIQEFEQLTAAGATIVSGSQAHQPQGFGFTNGGFIHFGVGNLFFDQMDYVENRQMFADKHIIYEGRHISTVLFTGIMEHWSQPRPMTPEERAEFLSLIFTASGW